MNLDIASHYIRLKPKKGVSKNTNSLIINYLSVIPKRFERLTHALEGRCSIQLSYGTILNCAAKVRTFIETCKKKTRFLLKSSLNRGFSACTFRHDLKYPSQS